MKELHVVAAIIEKDDKILIAQRLKGDLAGLWEFPGGKYETNETGQQAIKREIKEEFDADIIVNDLICTIKHQYETFLLVMDCYTCQLVSNELHLHDHLSYKWINPLEDNNVNWVKADVKVFNNYVNYLKKNCL